jgi:hypothetical protein
MYLPDSTVDDTFSSTIANETTAVHSPPRETHKRKIILSRC